jgi:SAM-dependent methyltransferase
MQSTIKEKQFECPNCNGSNSRIKRKMIVDESLFLVPELSRIERAWIECLNCGVYFSIPELNSKQIEKMYEIYRSTEFRGETPDQYFDRITSYGHKDSENFNKIEYMRSVIKSSPKDVLDIGCGGGVLIHSMKQNWPGAQYWGVEPSPEYCDLTARRTNAITKNSFYSDSVFPDRTFDLITCCQVFEHVKDLNSFAKAIRSNMHDQSLFYVEVPDASDFELLDESHSRFTEPSHLWYFDDKFLKDFFKNQKFKVLCSKVETTIRGRNNLTLILSKVVQ